MTNLRPFYENIEAHYDDLPTEFFALWLDQTLGYTCGYWPRPDMTSEEAQLAKFDLALGKLGLEPGMTLLDVGCGWGTGLVRAHERHDVNVLGLTISRNQYEFVAKRLEELPGPRTANVLFQGWEEFEGRADAILVVGAFEHFRRERYDAFFETAASILPEGGTLLLHTITMNSVDDQRTLGSPVNMSYLRFARHIMKHIFPGGQLPNPGELVARATRAGFSCNLIQPLNWNYAKTLDVWHENLVANKERAIELTSPEIYDQYDKYLEGCAYYFRRGNIDVMQFTLVKGHPEWLKAKPGKETFTAFAR